MQPWQRFLVIWAEPALSTRKFANRVPDELFREQNWRGIKPLWLVFSAGPDKDHDITDAEIGSHGIQDYDPTNETVSDGNITRVRE